MLALLDFLIGITSIQIGFNDAVFQRKIVSVVAKTLSGLSLLSDAFEDNELISKS